jgi:hypothetical protein
MEVSFARPLWIGWVVSGLSYFVCNFNTADIPSFKNLCLILWNVVAGDERYLVIIGQVHVFGYPAYCHFMNYITGFAMALLTMPCGWCPGAPTHLSTTPHDKLSSIDWWLASSMDEWGEKNPIQYHSSISPLLTLTYEFLLTLPVVVSKNGLFNDLLLFRVLPFTCWVKC